MNMTKLHIQNQTWHVASAKDELVIAAQEKARLREEFELSRQRLMKVSLRVQNLRATIYYGKEATNAR